MGLSSPLHLLDPFRAIGLMVEDLWTGGFAGSDPMSDPILRAARCCHDDVDDDDDDDDDGDVLTID